MSRLGSWAQALRSRTGTLISGSCALQFFDRTVYPESDLDLYVHMQHRREVGRWLIEEGYTYAPMPFQHPVFEAAVVYGMSPRDEGIYSIPGVSAVFTFTKPRPRQRSQNPEEEPEPTDSPPLNQDSSSNSATLGTVTEVDIDGVDLESDGEDPSEARHKHRTCEPDVYKVQVIVAKNTPMEAILAFHSTCVMNVISYEKAYCLFPRATLEERRSLLSSSCRGRSKRRATGLAKYTRRGFKMISTLAREDIEPDPATSLRLPPRGISHVYNSSLDHTPFLHGLPTALDLISLNDRRAGPYPPASTPSTTPAAPPKQKPAFRLGWRWIDDSASWVLSLPQTGVAPPPPANPSTPPRAHDPVAVCNWEVRYPAPAPAHVAVHAPQGAVMHFEVAAGKALRYRYLVTDEALLGMLGSELSARARAEEMKAHAELEEWTYYDWELPALCRQFLHGIAERRLSSLRL
ncbi:hypothetical protein C8Q77DRAFT_1215387 [Trametes polyzona]|nr:hypothetical protein C8Q77DRAFT_1215387 [Trametes polyzona]